MNYIIPHKLLTRVLAIAGLGALAMAEGDPDKLLEEAAKSLKVYPEELSNGDVEWREGTPDA